MTGYWQDLPATGQVLNDGWLRSGDADFVDEAGHLHVVQRLKEIMIVGSSNVYPADVQQVLMSYPTCSRRPLSHGPTPSSVRYRSPTSVPVPGRTLSAEDVIALFDERVADYKRPHDVLSSRRSPRTAFGRGQKHVLRSLAAGGTTDPVLT